MTGMRCCFVVLCILLLGASAFAEDKSAEQQYAALAQARTKAELAVRASREFFTKNEPAVRNAIAAADRARARTVDVCRKFAEQEQRKPENQRDLNAIDDANQKASQAQTDWDDQVTKPAAALDASFRQASQSTNIASQLFQTLTGMENSWKDGKFDLAPLQAAYEALAQRTTDQLAQAQKAQTDAQALQKTWETRQSDTAKALTPGKK